MLILRHLKINSLQLMCTRNYAKKVRSKMSMPKMIHQEIRRYVNLNARIDIETDVYLRVMPVDVHEHISGDLLIVQLWGGPSKNVPVELKVDTSHDRSVGMLIKKTKEDNSFFCVLQIPVRAELHIRTENEKVCVECIHGEALEIKAKKNIKCRELRCNEINLQSQTGDIECAGTLLAHKTAIESKGGNIKLGRLQGDQLQCKTNQGSIEVDCSYVEHSKFESYSGNLNLKNIHKTSDVNIKQGGALTMTGVHGKFNVIVNGGTMCMQISEILAGESNIVAQDMKDASVNISTEVESNTDINVNASGISLEHRLAGYAENLSADKKRLQICNSSDTKSKLNISYTGNKSLFLGKQSWADLMRNSIVTKNTSA